jgi:DNA adenine methylase
MKKVQEQRELYNIKKERLNPLLKWAGGKENELKYIHPLIPPFEKYYEPFVGGGAIFFSLQAEKKFINDKSFELINLYRMASTGDKKFFGMLDLLAHNWKLISNIVDLNSDSLIEIYKPFSAGKCSADTLRNNIFEFVLKHSAEFNGMFETSFNHDIENFIHEIKKNLISKTSRMKKLEAKKGKLSIEDVLSNLECALKSAFYMHFRFIYNNRIKFKISANEAAAIYFFIRENAYAAMFRYNSRGDFNVPYGGISYNRKDLDKKISALKSDEFKNHFKDTAIENLDFEDFLEKYPPQESDFIFVDPPYDTDFCTYAQNDFLREDQERLADYLIKKCKAKFMAVIKNTPFILNLYDKSNLNIKAFDKNYIVSFQARNDRKSEHLMITNYQ